MAIKIIIPSIKDTAFNCPHCGALTTQFWFHLGVKNVIGDNPVPFIIDQKVMSNMLDDIQNIDQEETWKIF